MSDKRLHPARPVRARSARAADALHSPVEPADSSRVVGIGASAGGLDACRRLLDALPDGLGMAYVMIQHLDPNHESMMADLLAEHTAMTVRQATDGMPLEAAHLYLIPPGSFLSIKDGALRLSAPQARHGARLPFDFFLNSLASECGARAVCVILSGTGSDGSMGLRAVKAAGGYVIAQDPDEAGYNGMPRNAIMTGGVDAVLPVAKIAEALAKFALGAGGATPAPAEPAHSGVPDVLPVIIDLLRQKTAHDFTLYKQGTLRRRVERRMSIASIAPAEMARYLEILRHDAKELDLLAKDLLINVTSFFRDPKVFDILAAEIVPVLVNGRSSDHPLRVWIAGCSTGEETYSLAMLFREAIAADQRPVKLQLFASDVDPDAVTRARDGLYPASIEADVSPARLARFFAKEGENYRVLPELRACVIFTVQDVLADPPFSRIDLVSCRNLLIYLAPEAQAKVLSLFHFALREDGVLVLGSSETVGDGDPRFEVISKTARIYRHIGRSRPGQLAFSLNLGDGARLPARMMGPGLGPSRQAILAALCQRLVLETFAPAAVLINRRHECLYSLGPTDLYLRVPPGPPTMDLLAMARPGVRTKLRAAIQRASQEHTPIVITGGRSKPDRAGSTFSIHIHPVADGGEDLLLVAFVDEPRRLERDSRAVTPADLPRVTELEYELDAARTELQGAIRNLELSNEEQKAINEEALSVNEEYQSTNEELLTSKEELQSLNEELTALNSQLQETLERQRTTSNDLQNVLYSTDIATLFLDKQLRIRFFTPATKSLFKVIPTDLGRPLSDLTSLAGDDALPADARAVLQSHTAFEREIETQEGVWFMRRILPYRTPEHGVEGVVITFTDVTERKLAARALEAAKHQAELANIAKSRFLAAASHDLRQPLQTLALLQGLLAKRVEGEAAQKLVARVDQTLGAMSGMLNTLLDINQIESGTVNAQALSFQMSDILDRLRDEFSYHAQAKGLVLRVVRCSQWVQSDPRLLEQMMRNLLSNALKYTKRGKVLIGCRRHGPLLGIEVWDTGIGIPESEWRVIFDDYHQVDNAARERTLGLGLGLAIVKRLGDLLGHRVTVRSQPGRGSVFAIQVDMPDGGWPPASAAALQPPDHPMAEVRQSPGVILVVEDDPEVRELLEILLTGEGHRVVTAADGPAALAVVARGRVRPDLVLADYNLPNGMNGLQAARTLRERLFRDVPVIILTGDISTAVLRDIAQHGCIHLDKPVKLPELTQIIERLLAAARAAATPGDPAPIEPSVQHGPPTIFVVDDDRHVRDELRSMLEDSGRTVELFASCEAFLDAYRPGREGTLLIDAYLPGMSGIELLQRLNAEGHQLPSIMITGHNDVGVAVQAMKAGASDFILKPIERGDLLASLDRAQERWRDGGKLTAWRKAAASHVAGLTPRQYEIMERVLAGQASKNIAADLGISQRTVENHRAAIMRRTGAPSLPALARLALAAAWNGADEPPG